jgi:hypothetical protein
MGEGGFGGNPAYKYGEDKKKTYTNQHFFYFFSVVYPYFSAYIK